MTRKLDDVINGILALLPSPGTFPELDDNLTTLKAELKILSRTGSYAPPEAAEDAAIWSRLGATLYRYLPSPTSYSFAMSISNLVQG